MSRVRILVVDDSRLICQVVCDAFTSDTFEVAMAEDGHEALRVLRDFQPDLIISDILMPRMDGWALCDELRRSPSTAGIPFIFLTTETDIPKRIKGLEMGADDYVVKPFAKEELVARARRLLRRRDGAGPAEEHAAAGAEPALTGHTDAMPMADLLQALGLNGRSGTLHLSGASVGRIYFDGGRILNAETQGLTGEKALFRMVSWPQARFLFEPDVLPSQVPHAVDGSTSSVLMEGFAHLDELRDLVASLPEAGRRLRIPADQLSSLESLPLTTMQRLILFAAGERGAPIEQIVDVVPERDLAVYTAVEDLLRRGLLEPAPDLRP